MNIIGKPNVSNKDIIVLGGFVIVPGKHRPVPLQVPNDCITLNEAVKRAEADCRITTIVLGKGEHVVGQDESGRNTLSDPA